MNYQARVREIGRLGDAPEFDLVWFNHAGGTPARLAYQFRQSIEAFRRTHLPSFRMLTPVPPLREEGNNAEFDGELTELADRYVAALREVEDFGRRPFALVGHSFGAVLAYEACQRSIAGGLLPSRLVVMSFPAPDRVTHETELHTLSDRELIDQVDELFGGVPADIRGDEEALAMFLPALRYDLGLLERYRTPDNATPIGIPVTACVGTDDRAVSLADIHRWNRFTDHAMVSLRTFPGDHFFPFERFPEVVEAALWDLG